MRIINLLTNRFTGCHSFTFSGEIETEKRVVRCQRMSLVGTADTKEGSRKEKRQKMKKEQSPKEDNEKVKHKLKNNKQQKQPMQIRQENSFSPHFHLSRDKPVSKFVLAETK